MVSTYDSGEVSIATMQHIAREARAWVVSSGVALHKDDIPDDFPTGDKIVDQSDSTETISEIG